MIEVEGKNGEIKSRDGNRGGGICAMGYGGMDAPDPKKPLL